MSMRYEIDTKMRQVYVTYTENVLSFYEWNKVMNIVLKDPLFQAGYGFLIDRRNITVTPEKGFGKSVALYIQAHLPQLRNSHFAVVVSGLATYGIMRMLQGVMGETEHFMIFRDIDKAKQWLIEEPPNPGPL
jgi:hypothetical protein